MRPCSNAISLAIDEAVSECLFSTAPSIHSRVLAISSSLPHAGDWLNVVPSGYLGFHLHGQEFRCCLCYSLGVPLHSNPYPCPECRGRADSFGDHQVGCSGNGNRVSCHNATHDVVFTAAKSAALAPTKETLIWCPSPCLGQQTSSSQLQL